MSKNSIPCTQIKYREFPDLLFGRSENGTLYFDATHYLTECGDIKKHNIRNFEISFLHFKNAVSEAYSIPLGNIFISDPASGHILIDESLALAFIAYVDPFFAVYMLERIDELFLRGIVLSDTYISMLAEERLSKDDNIQK